MRAGAPAEDETGQIGESREATHPVAEGPRILPIIQGSGR